MLSRVIKLQQLTTVNLQRSVAQPAGLLFRQFSQRNTSTQTSEHLKKINIKKFVEALNALASIKKPEHFSYFSHVPDGATTQALKNIRTPHDLILHAVNSKYFHSLCQNKILWQTIGYDSVEDYQLKNPMGVLSFKSEQKIIFIGNLPTATMFIASLNRFHPNYHCSLGLPSLCSGEEYIADQIATFKKMIFVLAFSMDGSDIHSLIQQIKDHCEWESVQPVFFFPSDLSAHQYDQAKEKIIATVKDHSYLIKKIDPSDLDANKLLTEIFSETFTNLVMMNMVGAMAGVFKRR